MIPVMGFAAPSGTGKTTLMEQVIGALAKRGYKVAAVKHGHHPADPDVPGKDTHRFRQAGARTVLFDGPGLWFMIQSDTNAPSLDDHLARLQDHHLILVEGYKDHDHPKILVSRSDSNPKAIAPLSHVVGVACDVVPDPLPEGAVVLPLDSPAQVARFIVEHFGLSLGRS